VVYILLGAITPWAQCGTWAHRLELKADSTERKPPLAPGIPVNMFTVVFAVGRSIGWISQWSEMAAESVERISRPRWGLSGHNLSLKYFVVDRSAIISFKYVPWRNHGFTLL